MDLSVIVPTYNQADIMQESLRSLVDQTLPKGTYEIVVVDDGSTDHTAAVLREFGPPVKVVRFTANRGRSAARNAGIRAASGRLIVLVDSDIIVRRDFLERHLQTHWRKGAGILSRGPVIDVAAPSEAKNGRIPPLAASPAYLTTANAAVEKAALLRAGLFDERFPAYGWEDFELGFRLRKLGIQRVFSRQAVAFHVAPRDEEEEVAALLEKEKSRAKSALYFYRKHPMLETRLLIAATPVHRAIYWLQALGGTLDPNNVSAVNTRLRRVGFNSLAHLLLRGVLNRYYLQVLESERGSVNIA